MNYTYNLFLDDIRYPIHVKQALHNGKWELFPSDFEWVIVRSFSQFVETIIGEGLPSLISFDHDLSYEDTNKQDYSEFVQKTGYDCAKWLANYCLINNLQIPDFYVHSANPMGRMSIFNFLKNFQETHLNAGRTQ